MSKWKVAQGDCLAVLKTAPDNFFDAMVSDPPAGVSFMGREWDSDKGGRDQWVAWLKDVMAEAMRCLKPGAHCLVWALPRTSHWTATALEDAGFEVRDCITHHFGSGFPKSADISKSIDKLAGAEREVVGTTKTRDLGRHGHIKGDMLCMGEGTRSTTIELTAPATTEAKTWDGWGTALKPATEHWILCRKPLAASSIARNVLTHGTGALNIAGTRVNRAADDVPGWHKSGANGSGGYNGTDTFAIREMSAEEIQERCSGGRWPANLLLSHSADCADECAADCPVAELDRQSGTGGSGTGKQKVSAGTKRGTGTWTSEAGMQKPGQVNVGVRDFGDSGGASRFFPTFRYQAKPARGEKEAGLDALPVSTLNRVNPGGLENEPRFAPVQVKNNHPTVKSVELMRWLCRLITPPGGAVLDPFAGSGSTGVGALLEGFDFFGIEQDPHYVDIARARLAHWAAQK